MSDGELQVQDVPGARVLVLSGEVDVNVAPPLVARLAELLEQVPATVLDLAAVSFFDSSGVRLVDELARACAARGLDWRVVAPERSPGRRVLELVGMAGAEVVADRATALDQLSRRP